MLETFSDCAANPLRLALGLFSALKRKGVTIATDTHVKTVARTPGTAVLLTTATGHTVRAERVIVADNNWPAAHQLVSSSFRFRAVPVTSHIMITKPIPGIKERWGGQLMWDSYRIYHYLRLLDDGRILIGGEDKPIRQSPHGTMTDSRAPENQHLLHEIKKRFPGTAPEIDFGWSGRLSYPLDGLPVVMNAGPVTCCIADGLIQSWLAARMAVERITRGSSPLDWLYDSKRKFGPLNDLFLALPLPAFLKKRALLTGLVVEKIFDLADKWYIH